MLVAKQSEISLGKLKFGVPYSFKFTLTNTSKDPATITKLILGCNSCTKASSDKATLAHGESSDINVTFTPGSTGINNKKISVQYTSAGKAMAGVDLKFKAMVDV